MTYLEKKSLINDAYARFTANFVNREVISADEEYPFRVDCFVKCIYKVLLNQTGDPDIDILTKEEIQNCIVLMNKYSDSAIAIEYEES